MARKQKKRKERHQSTGAMIFKIALGLMFVAVSFVYIADKDFIHLAVGLIMGGAFIAWGLLPYREERRLREAEEKARDQRILETPLELFGDPNMVPGEAEKLAEHYEEKE